MGGAPPSYESSLSQPPPTQPKQQVHHQQSKPSPTQTQTQKHDAIPHKPTSNAPKLDEFGLPVDDYGASAGCIYYV